MKEKDKQTTAQLLRHYQIECGPLNAIAKDIFESSVLKALTTIRQEARAAAFREMTGVVAVLPPQGTMNYRRGYEEGVRDALRTIEAAANSVKDSEE